MIVPTKPRASTALLGLVPGRPETIEFSQVEADGDGGRIPSLRGEPLAAPEIALPCEATTGRR
jgi:hypothetical protein